MSHKEQALKKAEAICGQWFDAALRDRVAIALLRERADTMESYATHSYEFDSARELKRIADEMDRRK